MRSPSAVQRLPTALARRGEVSGRAVLLGIAAMEYGTGVKDTVSSTRKSTSDFLHDLGCCNTELGDRS